jgi:hypothetical protein
MTGASGCHTIARWTMNCGYLDLDRVMMQQMLMGFSQAVQESWEEWQTHLQLPWLETETTSLPVED